MSNESLINELAANLAPVQRRSILRETGFIVALGAVELALFLAVGLMRPDMGEAIGSPYMWWKLGSLAVLVGLCCAIAIRSFSPTSSPRRGLTIAAAVAAAAAVVGALIDPGAASGATILDRLAPMEGLVCAACIIVLSLPMLGMLAILMRRGAPTHPEASAIAIGLTAGSWGALVFAFCCRSNDPLYVTTWYLLGGGAVAAAARAMLPRKFRL